MYKVILSNKTLKQLDKIPTEIYLRIYQKLKSLSENPRPHGCIKLTNSEDYRIRIGNYRVLYSINDINQTIEIYNIQHRKDVYRKK